MPAPKYNEKTHTIIVTALRNRASLTSAAGQAGITYRALRSWLDSEDEQYEQLQFDVAEAEAAHEEYLRRLAESAATEGDGATIRFLLERRFPKTYGAKQALEHTGKDGGPIETTSVSPEAAAAAVKEVFRSNNERALEDSGETSSDS